MSSLLAWIAAAVLSLFSGPAAVDVGVSEPAPPTPERAYVNETTTEPTPGVAWCPVGEPEPAPAPPPYRRTFHGTVGPLQPTLQFSFPVEDPRAARVVVRADAAGGEFLLAVLDPGYRPVARALGAGDLAAEATRLPTLGPYHAVLSATRAPPLPTEVTVEVLVEFAAEPPAPATAWAFPAWAPAGVSAQGFELAVWRAGAPQHVRVAAAGHDPLRVTVRDTWGNEVVRATAAEVDVDLLPEWGPSPYLVVEDARVLGRAFDVELRTQPAPAWH